MIARVLAAAVGLVLVGCTAAVHSPAEGFGPARDLTPVGTFTALPGAAAPPITRSIENTQPAEPTATATRGEVPIVAQPVQADLLPEVIDRVAPEYPEAAKLAGTQGTVIVQCFVGVNGAVGETRIEKSIPALDAAAIAAVKQWRFKPAISDGRPAAVWVAVPVEFPPR